MGLLICFPSSFLPQSIKLTPPNELSPSSYLIVQTTPTPNNKRKIIKHIPISNHKT